MENRIYNIVDGIPFRAGILPDGSQALVSRFASEAIVVRFTDDGRLLSAVSTNVGPETEMPDRAIDSVVAQIGLISQSIKVRQFSIPKYGIEIRDIPEYLQEFIDDPSGFPNERAVHLRKAVDEWRHRQGYVLVWGEDYEMGVDGTVDSN